MSMDNEANSGLDIRLYLPAMRLMPSSVYPGHIPSFVRDKMGRVIGRLLRSRFLISVKQARKTV